MIHITCHRKSLESQWKAAISTAMYVVFGRKLHLVPAYLEVHLYQYSKRNHGYTVPLIGGGYKIVVYTKGVRWYDVVRTLVHEMVHVEQYSRGTLSQNREGLLLWRGVASPKLQHDSIRSHRAWRVLPWECEANIKSARLVGKVLLLSRSQGSL